MPRSLIASLKSVAEGSGAPSFLCARTPQQTQQKHHGACAFLAVSSRQSAREHAPRVRLGARLRRPIPDFTDLARSASLPQADTEEPVAAPVVEEIKPHLPNPRQGEHVFGVAHIFASFNDTFVVRIPSPAAYTGATRRFSGVQTLDEDFP